MNQPYHIPVMPLETIQSLNIKPNGVYFDGTLGGGGHASLIAKKLKASGGIIGVDQDIEAIEYSKKRLKPFICHQYFINDNFQNLDLILESLKIKQIDGILLDLGVSTHQLETSYRGFSYQENIENTHRLDMRMNINQALSAYEVVNKYHEGRLRDILYRLGEEPYVKSIARQIVKRRAFKPIETPNDLLEVIKSATPPKYRFSRRHHWASKVFRALRMEVNQEISAIEIVLPKAVEVLKPHGRLVVISFHSLEDKIVKHTFRQLALNYPDKYKIVTKKPLRPAEQEITDNPKADSAKLRVLEKLK